MNIEELDNFRNTLLQQVDNLSSDELLHIRVIAGLIEVFAAGEIASRKSKVLETEEDRIVVKVEAIADDIVTVYVSNNYRGFGRPRVRTLAQLERWLTLNGISLRDVYFAPLPDYSCPFIEEVKEFQNQGREEK